MVSMAEPLELCGASLILSRFWHFSTTPFGSTILPDVLHDVLFATHAFGTWAANSLFMICSLTLVLTCLASSTDTDMSDGVGGIVELCPMGLVSTEIVGPIVGFVGLSDAFPDMDEHSSAE
jgi:hypothetical protein